MSNTRRSQLLLLAALLAGIAGTQPAYTQSKMQTEESTFWSLVERAKAEAGADRDLRPRALQRLLEALTLPEIQAFQRKYESYLLSANHWELWGAAYLMNGSSSDDGFKYFRDWLISEGQETFNNGLSRPDTLSVIPQQGDYFELEAFGYAALKAFASKGGGELDRDFNVELAAPTGKRWKESDLPTMLPRLAGRFLRK